MSNIVEVDHSQVEEMLSKIDATRRSEVIMKALYEGAKALKKETQNELTKTNIRVNSPSRFNGRTLMQGVNIKRDNVCQEISVDIMGDFRLKFFEKGTKDRYTKGHNVSGYIDSHHIKREGNGGYRGIIIPKHFFLKARNNETPIYEAIKKVLDKEL